jgi:hypothetical protein
MGNTDNDIGRSARRLRAPLAVLALTAVATAGCAAGSVTTTEGAGSTIASARRPAGTILVADPSGENAATMLGQSVAVIPPPTTPAPTTTTTAAPTTVPTTLAPVTTPRVTAAPTVPTTSAPVTSLSIPSSKPALSPMNMASLSADEQSIVNGVNKIRAANGLGGVAPEQHATDTARQHAAVMAAAGQPSNIDDVFGKVNAAYKTITQITFNYPAGQDAAQFALGQYAGQLAGPFTSMGIGVVVSAGQRYIVVLIGA